MKCKPAQGERPEPDIEFHLLPPITLSKLLSLSKLHLPSLQNANSVLACLDLKQFISAITVCGALHSDLRPSPSSRRELWLIPGNEPSDSVSFTDGIKHYCLGCIWIMWPQRKDSLVQTPKASFPILPLPFSISGVEGSMEGREEGLWKYLKRDQRRWGFQTLLYRPFPGFLVVTWPIPPTLGSRHHADNLTSISQVSCSRVHPHFTELRNSTGPKWHS